MGGVRNVTDPGLTISTISNTSNTKTLTFNPDILVNPFEVTSQISVFVNNNPKGRVILIQQNGEKTSRIVISPKDTPKLLLWLEADNGFCKNSVALTSQTFTAETFRESFDSFKPQYNSPKQKTYALKPEATRAGTGRIKPPLPPGLEAARQTFDHPELNNLFDGFFPAEPKPAPQVKTVQIEAVMTSYEPFQFIDPESDIPAKIGKIIPGPNGSKSLSFSTQTEVIDTQAIELFRTATNNKGSIILDLPNGEVVKIKPAEVKAFLQWSDSFASSGQKNGFRLILGKVETSELNKFGNQIPRSEIEQVTNKGARLPQPSGSKPDPVKSPISETTKVDRPMPGIDQTKGYERPAPTKLTSSVVNTLSGAVIGGVYTAGLTYAQNPEILNTPEGRTELGRTTASGVVAGAGGGLAYAPVEKVLTNSGLAGRMADYASSKLPIFLGRLATSGTAGAAGAGGVVGGVASAAVTAYQHRNDGLNIYTSADVARSLAVGVVSGAAGALAGTGATIVAGPAGGIGAGLVVGSATGYGVTAFGDWLGETAAEVIYSKELSENN
ncbi:MAG: hypothetical protein ABIH50_05165 [bacterium]